MEVISYSEFRKNLKKSLNSVVTDSDVLIVHRKANKNVVLILLKEYNSMKETMYLLSRDNNRTRLKESIDEMK